MRPGLGIWRDRVVPEAAGPVFLAGILLGLAHPPFRLLIPSFVALVPFIVWHERLPATVEGARQARVGGFFLGLIYYSLLFYWLLVALIYYTAWAILAFLGPVVIMSWFLAAMSGAIHAARRRARWPLWLAFPVFWTANEWFRAHLADVAFPWMQLGDSLTAYPKIIGVADLVGSRGVSFWLVTVNALVAGLWLAQRTRGKAGEGRRLRTLAVALFAVLAVPIGYSLIRWNTLELRPAARVGIVQPNVPEHVKAKDQAAAANLAIAATDSLVEPWRARGEALDLVLLPESAIPLILDPIPSLGYEAWEAQEVWADGLAVSLGADMLYGALGVRDIRGVDYEMYNSAFLTSPGHRRVARYDKRFLVPVVERVPFLNPRWFSGLTYFGGFGVGPWTDPYPLAADAGPTSYGVMICYESIFSSLARHYRRGGAEFLVNVTNDAWFGRDAWWSRSSALWQHPAHLVMRAIETRMGVARSGNTGVSELIDPLGRVSHATPLFEPAAFVGDVMTTDSMTVYVRFGDLVGWACVLAAMLAVTVSIRRGRRTSSNERRPSPVSPGASRSGVGSVALLAAALAGPLASPLRAQVRPDSAARVAPRDTLVFNLEDLRVRATRPLATTSGASAVRLSLLSPRLEPVPLLEDALRAMPFVQVRENSRGEAQLTLRGTESRQIAVFVDGVPLSLGWDARTDLSVIPTDAAREVELFRGIPSVLHGPNVLGGVVEIDLASGQTGDEPPRSGIQGGLDDTGATVFGGRFGDARDLGTGRLSIQAGVGRRSRDGVPLAAGVTQPVEPEPGQRLNSDFDHTSGFLAARYEALSGAWASLSSFAFHAERGVPPELHLSDPRLWRIPEVERVVTAITAGTAWGETPLGKGDVEVSLGLDLGDTQIDAYQTLAYETIKERQFSDTRTITARAVADHTLGAGILRSAFTWAQTDHDERDEDASAPSLPAPTRSFTQRIYSLGAEFEHPVTTATRGFWSGVRLTAGGSFDHAATPKTGGVQPRGPLGAWGARVGASALLGDRGRVHMGASRRVRFPSLRELYSGALGRFVPNPELDPEVLRALEAGITGTVGAFSGELEGQAVLFYQTFSDAIVRTGLGDGRFRRENRNRVSAGGLELLAAWSVNRWSVGGDVTWQNVTLTDDLAPAVQRRAEYQPEIAGSVNVSGPVLGDVIARAEVAMVGRQYCVDPELERDVALTGTARLDLLVSREWGIGGPFRRLQASAGLHNVTDAAVFDQCGLPQPGRLFRAQFRIF